MDTTIAGNLLVATPTMDDTPFARSVCLVLHHDDNHVVGVVLNRPLEADVQGQADDADAITSMLAKQGLHFGGPKAGPILALHNCAALAEAETAVGLYVAANAEHVERLVQNDDLRCRLIVGHVEWSIEELHQQVSQGCWAVVPATADVVLETNESMWPHMMRKANSMHLAGLVGAKHIPPHPALN